METSLSPSPVIYEIEIVHLALRGGAEYAEACSQTVREPEVSASLLGFFQADIGRLNRALLLWKYEDAEQRGRVRSALAARPPAPHLVEGSAAKTYKTVHILPRPRTGAFGGVYEVRTYQGHPGKMESAIQHWEKHLPARLTLSPCVALFFSELAPDGSWEYVHFWPYRDLNHRAEARARSHEASWPPGTAEYARTVVKSQQSEIWLPAPFSPMH